MRRISFPNFVSMVPAFLALFIFAAFFGCGSDVALQMDDETYVFTDEDWEASEDYENEDGWDTEKSDENEWTFDTNKNEEAENSTATYETVKADESTGTYETVKAEERVGTFEIPDPVTEETASNVNMLDMSIMNTVHDYGMEGMARGFEAKPLFHLFSYISNMTDTQCETIDFEEASIEDMLDSSDTYRGAPVWVGGTVVWLAEKSMATAAKNHDGPTSSYHGLLMDEDGKFCYFLTLDPPAWLMKDTPARVNGFFFRNYAYRTKSQKMQTTPVVIVKYFEEY